VDVNQLGLLHRNAMNIEIFCLGTNQYLIEAEEGVSGCGVKYNQQPHSQSQCLVVLSRQHFSLSF